jgi:hypothetical protein
MEVYIKTVRYHYTSIRIAKIQNTKHQIVARIVGQWNTYSLLMGMQNGTDTLEDILAVSFLQN